MNAKIEHETVDLDQAFTPDWSAGRRAFIRNCGLAAAGAAALNLTGATAGTAAAQAVTDADILNFALNLEYLEAEFYLHATTGDGLGSADITGTGAAGPVVGGKKVKFDTKAIRLYAEEIAADELAHVRFLRTGLGSAAVARPKININGAFTAAAKAAGLISGDAEFDAYANETNFLLASFIFEDVGVTAYKGAAALISDKGILEAAAGILSVEAYHAGIVRTLLFQKGLFKEAQAISAARDSLDGNSQLDQAIGNIKGKSNLVPTDANGITYSRTVPQVRSIVYLGGEGKGGFFPLGINGIFAS